MSQNRPSPSPLQNVSWPLVLALGAVGLVLPIVHVTGLADAWGTAVTSILAIAVVTVVWVGVVVTRHVAEPLLTTMLAGLTFGVLATVLSGILTPFTEGELQGPLTNPVALVGLLVTGALWGAVAGAAALAVSSSR